MRWWRGRHADRDYVRLASRLGRDDWAWSAGAAAAGCVCVDGSTAACGWSSATERGQRIRAWRWERIVLHGSAGRREWRGHMMRYLFRKLDGRHPVLGGSMLNHAVVAWQGQAVAGRLQIWFAATCKRQVVRRWRRQRSSEVRALLTAEGTALEGSGTTLWQHCVLSIKGWTSVVGGIQDTGDGTGPTAALGALTGRPARSQERRDASDGGCRCTAVGLFVQESLWPHWGLCPTLVGAEARG